MAYVATLNITSATSSGLIIAPQASFPDASAATVSTLADAVLKSSYVRNGGKIVNIDKNGYLENIHVSNGGYIQNRGANTSAKDIYVSQGGFVYIQSGTTYTNLEIFSGGTALQFVGTVNGMTIHSGGTGMFSTWGQGQLIYNGLTVDAGAKFTTYNNFIMKGTVSIAAGAWTNAAAAHTVDGVLCDYNVANTANFSSGVTLSRTTVGAGTTLNVFYTSAKDVDMSGAMALRFAEAYASDVRVSAGTFYIQSGASADNVHVYTGGSMQFQTGAVKGLVVEAGGVVNRGWVGANAAVNSWEDIDVKTGASMTLDASYKLKGNINIAAGALTNDTNASAVDGTIYDLDLGLTGSFGSGITLSNFNQTAGAITLVDGASIKTGTMANGAYLLYLGGGGTVADYTMAGGTLHASNGGIVSGATLDTGAQINISTGAFGYDLTLNGGLAAVRGETAYVSGATVNAGTFYIQSNGSAEDVHVYEGGSMQFHYGKVNGLVIEAGGVVNKGWGGENERTWENVTAKAGASMTLDTYFGLKGDLNIAAGALTNDADAHAADGVLEDFDFGMTYGTIASGITLSNFTQTAGTMNVKADAAVKTAALNAGTLNVAAGATARNVTQNAGTLNIAAGADVDGLAFKGGSFAIVSGLTIKNYDQYVGSDVNVVNDAVVDGGTMYAGQLQALNNKSVSRGTIKNYTVSGGILIVRGAGNVAENITVYNGGVAAIQSGATGRNIEVFSGGNVQAPSHAKGAQVAGLTMHDGATGTFVANDALPVNIGNLVMEQGAQLSITSAKISGAAITGGELTIAGNSNYLSGGATGATIDNLTVKGTGQLWINDPYDAEHGGAAYGQMVNSNMTVEAGAWVFMHGTNVYGSDAQVYGTYYVQNGATLSGGTIHDGGYANMWLRANYNDKNVRAKMVGVTISAGGSADATDADFANMTVEAGGRLALNGNAGLGGNANTIAAGTLIVDGAIDADAATDENHALCNLNVSAQTLNVKDGIALKDLSIGHAGRVIATDATITGFDVEAPDQAYVGRLYLSSGTVASGGRLNGQGTVNAIYLTDGAKLNEMHVSNGGIFMSADAEMTNLEMTGGIVILRGEQTYISGATVTDGDLYLQNGGDGDAITVAGGGLSAYDTDFTNPAGKTEVVNHVTMTDGRIYVGSGATMTDVNATGGTVEVRNGGVLNAAAGNTLNNLNTVAGAKVNVVKAGDNATFQGDDTNVDNGTLYFSGNAVAGRAENGVFTGFTATQLFKFSFGDGIVVNDVDLNNGEIRVSCFDGASVDTARVSAGAIICNVGAYGTMNNVTLVKAGIMNLSGTAAAYDTVVSSGGQFALNAATVRAENTTLKAGAKFNLNAAGANTGNLLTLDFTGTGGDQAVYINNMANISDDTRIELTGWTENNTYTLTTGAATTKTVHMYNWGLYDDAVAGGATYTNAFYGAAYDFTDGKKIVVNGFDVAAKATAGTITTADVAINGNERVAKWDSDTAYSGSVTVAGGGLADDVWLEIDGTNVSTALYGASSEFTHGINLYVRSGDIRNLAAGSRDGDGTVASVKLTLGNAHLEGTAYAAGFGSVAGAAETLIEGGTFAKDFYAGALDNYAKGSGVKGSQVGSVALTVTDGDFAGNIYGASAVKAGSYAYSEVVHSVTDGISISLEGGRTTKDDFCMFAGGYATGDASDVTVYTVGGGIDVTVAGGSWGEARGGRGIFGGAFASGVTAEANNVSITISGDAEIGNVFGGGWAQKNGTSTVGDVVIDIMGGTVANVFGGGSTSTSGGATVTGDVTITVAGGDIAGDIYAMGQGVNDSVASAAVTFTGEENFYCGVFGYTYVGGGDSDATLSYTDYTGKFYGAVGGFDSISFAGSTATELVTPYTEVSNGNWKFDLADRASALADTSLLTWSNSDFAGDTVRVNFADADQAAAGWSIAAADFTGATFDLFIGDSEIKGGIAYDTAIADGDWAGWKFTSVDGTLKFAQLA